MNTLSNLSKNKKRIGFYLLRLLQIDRFFKQYNRRKLLILAYHGVTKNVFPTPPWVQIPLSSFENQIKYLTNNYTIITLQEGVEFLANNNLPKNPAIITFDDGYRNNFTLALPILKKYGVPATIFPAAGYIGTDNLLPLDRAYLIIMALKGCKSLTIPEIGLGPLFFNTNDDLNNSYNETVRALKRFSTQNQEKYLLFLEDYLPENANYKEGDLAEEFLLLSWEETQALIETGLITLGAHTVTHDILTNLTAGEAIQQIIGSRNIIQKNLNHPINLFAYPNGTEADYTAEHASYLKNNGFICSVTTIPRLNNSDCNPYNLGRICIGPELSADFDHFVLKISGFLPSLKTL